MNFTYNGYSNLLNQLKEHGYTICSYSDWKRHDKCVILRHDIDTSIHKALQLAKLETSLGGTKHFLRTANI